MPGIILQSVIGGINLGVIYAFVALGFFLVASVTGLLNFAQGEFVMLGGMVMVTSLAGGVPLVPALLLGVVVAGVIGAALYTGVIGRAKGASHLTLILATIGVSMILKGLALWTWGWESRGMATFPGVRNIEFLGATIFGQTIWVLGIGLIIALALYFFFERTMLGKAFRACADEPEGASIIGISVGRMALAAFILAGLLGAVAGAVMTPLTMTSYEIGLPLSVKGLLAALVGGITNIRGAVVGGLALGMATALAAGLVSSSFADAIVLSVFLVILVFRPAGLVGGQGH